MKAKILFALTILYFIPIPVSAQEQIDGLLISQVQVSGVVANDEFIEIHNYSGQPISLLGWSVQYKTSTGTYPLGAKKNLPDFVVPAFGYFLLAHEDYLGSVVTDLTYSTFSLSGAATGATIFLSKSQTSIMQSNDPNIIDQLAYGTAETNSPLGSSAILPPSGQSLFRTASTKNNLTDFEIKLSDPKNSSMQESIPNQETPPEEEPEEEAPADQESNLEEEIEPEFSDKIIISEVMPNPQGTDTGNEWLELYNQAPVAVDLKDWIVDDNSIDNSIGTSAYTLPPTTIAPTTYLKIAIPTGKFSLNNSSADSIRLFWPNKVKLIEVAYTPPALENQSWCKIGEAYKWCAPTPVMPNQELVVAIPDEEEEEEVKNYSDAHLSLIEIMPDPGGPDSGSEYVKVLNTGTNSVNLINWILDDGSKDEKIGSSSFKLVEYVLDAGEEYIIEIPKGKFALNNTTQDGVRLFSPDKILEDYVEYDKAQEGIEFVKIDGIWKWNEVSDVIEEEEANLEDQKPEVKNTQAKKGKVKSAKLPRSGISFSPSLFVFLVAIWYIGCELTNKNRIYEQTRSHRRISSKVGK
jgi:hypothetical protein